VTHNIGANWYEHYLINSKGRVPRARGKDSSLTTQPDPHVTLWLLKVATLTKKEMYIAYVLHLTVPSRHDHLGHVAMIIISHMHSTRALDRACICAYAHA
jgi:hypothetical protein